MTPKQRIFALEYLVDLNAAQAAIRAGYSPATAEVQGWRLLRNASVAAFLAEQAQKRASKLEISADRVAQEMAKIAFVDPRRLVQWRSRLVSEEQTEEMEEQPNGGALKRTRGSERGGYVTDVILTDSDDLDDDTAAAISEVSHTAQGVKIKMHDKLAALAHLGRYTGMFKDDPGQQMTVRFVIEHAPAPEDDR